MFPFSGVKSIKPTQKNTADLNSKDLNTAPGRLVGFLPAVQQTSASPQVTAHNRSVTSHSVVLKSKTGVFLNAQRVVCQFDDVVGSQELLTVKHRYNKMYLSECLLTG